MGGMHLMRADRSAWSWRRVRRGALLRPLLASVRAKLAGQRDRGGPLVASNARAGAGAPGPFEPSGCSTSRSCDSGSLGGCRSRILKMEPSSHGIRLVARLLAFPHGAGRRLSSMELVSLLFRQFSSAWSLDAGAAALDGGRSGGSPASPVAAVLVVFFGREGGRNVGGWRSWRGSVRCRSSPRLRSGGSAAGMGGVGDPRRCVGGCWAERKLKPSVDAGVGDARGRRFSLGGDTMVSTLPPSCMLRVKTLVF